MAHVLILLVVALVAAALVFGVVTMITGGDHGLVSAEPDGVAVPLPLSRPLTENDLTVVRFDTAFRGYRMAEVDHAFRRTAYDLGYKEELINVLEAEVSALREGRLEDADELRRARERAARSAAPDDEEAEGAAETDDDASGADGDEADEAGHATGDAAERASGEAADSADQDDETAARAGSSAERAEEAAEQGGDAEPAGGDGVPEPRAEMSLASRAAEHAETP
jgi:DivIVA domain-containing protein